MYNFTFSLNPSEKKPLYEQLYEYIALQIREKKFEENERMPSKKALSAHLGISVNTVETAYEILVQEGYLKSAPRSGFYVQRIEPPINSSPIEIEDELSERKIYKADFRTNAVDINSFPYSTWVKLSKEVMYGNPELLNSGEVKGDYELRENIAKYLHEFRGVNCSPRQIIVGAGIEYLIMILTELLGKNRNYAIENPGYEKIEKILKNSGCNVNYIDLDEKGISAKMLDDTASDTVYITPSHQFPTGIIMPIDRRIELLNWASASDNRYIIEDDYNSEFNFSKRPITALQGIFDSENVIYLNTFSRILAPSIRIAYMVLPKKLLSVYEERFYRYSSTVPRFEQHTLNRFISENYLSRHLNRVKNIYRKRRDLLIEVLKSLPFDIEISGEKAGLHLLFKSSAAADILNIAEKYDIKLYNSDDYYFTPQSKSKNTIIVGYAGVSNDDIDYLRQCLNK
jgi:GntR family transcriptional regulator/MocR family aminotransferase